MRNSENTLLSLVVATAIVAGVFVAASGSEPGSIIDTVARKIGISDQKALPSGQVPQAQVEAKIIVPKWTASAPGKVEPRDGVIRISPQAPGRIVEVPVKMNDVVKAGDLLVRLDDGEARAKLRAASALAGARKRERDKDDVNRLATRRRDADDEVYDAREELRVARETLDAEAAKLRKGEVTADKLDEQRKKIADAVDKLDKAREKLRDTRNAKKVPLETVKESLLSDARAQVALAEVALERTQIRAPADGTVMELVAKVGETVVPSPSNVLVRMGDMSALRVRAEVEERDVGNVRAGQKVIVRSKAFPGQDFVGKVDTLARRLGPNRIAAKGPRRPTDLDVLEVMVNLEGTPPLLPGMRVDSFFEPEGAKMETSSTSKMTNN